MNPMARWTARIAVLVGARAVDGGYRWGRWRVRPWWLIPVFIAAWLLTAFAIGSAMGDNSWQNHSGSIVPASLVAVWMAFTWFGAPPRVERELARRKENERRLQRQHRQEHPEEYCTHVWESYSSYSSDYDGDSVFKRCRKCWYIIAVEGHDPQGKPFRNPLPLRGTGKDQ